MVEITFECDITGCESQAGLSHQAGRRFCQAHAEDLVAFAYIKERDLTLIGVLEEDST